MSLYDTMNDMSDHNKKNQAAHAAAYERRMRLKAARVREVAAAQAKEDARQKAEDEHFMKEALKQARKALALHEVPIGCVIVKDGRILARGYNRRNADHSVLSHAEVAAIKKAAHALDDWRLSDCTLYVTLEPCPMCAGAIEQARIRRVVFGAASDKTGSAGSILNILQNDRLNHQALVTGGVLAEECGALLSDFFAELRE